MRIIREKRRKLSGANPENGNEKETPAPERRERQPDEVRTAGISLTQNPGMPSEISDETTIIEPPQSAGVTPAQITKAFAVNAKNGEPAKKKIRRNAKRKPKAKAPTANPKLGASQLPGDHKIPEAEVANSGPIEKRKFTPEIIKIPWANPNSDKLSDDPQQVTARPVKPVPQKNEGAVVDRDTCRIVIPPTPAVNHQVPGKKALTVIAFKGDSLPGDRLLELAKKLRAGLPGCGGSYIHYSGECCKSRRFENLIFLLGGQ